LVDAAALARQHAPAAIAALVRGLRDPERYIIAAQTLLDRGFGRAAQHVTTETTGSMTVLHLLAARAIAAELPTIEAKPEPEKRSGLHLSIPDE
jgi:hypothetical protein